MRNFVAAVLAVLAVLALGCSAATPPAASPSQVAVVSPSTPASVSVPSPTSVAPSPTAVATASPAPTVAGSPTAGPTLEAGVLDPCTLLDPATELAVLGGSSGAPHLSSPTDWGPQCDYPTPAGVVQVVTFRPEVSDTVFDSADNKIEISALGDSAFYDTDWSRLRVKVGSDRFQVSCFCVLPSGTDQATLTTLAASAAARLATKVS
jgi:hypothetical protein